MLGYSDLLLNTALTEEQKPLAAKIGQYVRRTKSLVASLISFARQTPAAKTLLDLNTLARTAIKLTQPQWEAMEIEIRTQFDASLPKVLGDSNQLLQVCLQLIANALHVLMERNAKVLVMSSTQQGHSCILRIGTDPVRSSDSDSSSNSGDVLALSACQGILQEHRGLLTCEHHENGSLLLEVELPAAEAVPANAKEATVPVMWQSRPFA